MNDHEGKTDLNIKPTMGWISVSMSAVEGVIKQTIRDSEVDSMMDQLEQHPLQALAINLRSGDTEPVSLADLFGRGQPSRDDVREMLEETNCKFECGIVIEIGMLPPGFPEPPFEQGSKVFFHEGKGIDIAGVKLIGIESIIGWTDD